MRQTRERLLCTHLLVCKLSRAFCTRFLQEVDEFSSKLEAEQLASWRQTRALRELEAEAESHSNIIAQHELEVQQIHSKVVAIEVGCIC
jgi:hypothetical protein